MKINFWQILGLLLILAGLAGVLYREFVTEKKPATPTSPPLTTQPGQ